MRAWKELTTLALQGTSKAPAGTEAERRLLKEAGWHTLRRLAGHKPPQLQLPALAEARPESQPYVSRLAANRLDEILRTDDHGHLEEWLMLCASVEKLVPASLLPPLLEQAAGKANLRRSVLETGGQRVRWLASRNEEWSFAAITDPLEAFKSGSRPARVAALMEMRRQDPAAALTTLMDGWTQEGGDDRTALIGALATGLGPADEVFLSQATADSRKEVRTAAADLIALLPGSGLTARMTARADGWISYRKGLLGGKLEVSPPTVCDEGMIADGIEARAPKNVGERAHWLRQVLSFVPPSHWPPDVIGLATKTDWAEPLLLGWIEGATRFRDGAWCEALIEHHLQRADRAQTLPRLDRLVQATPAGIAEAIIMRHVQRDARTAITLASMTVHQLSLECSKALLLSVHGVVKQKDIVLKQFSLGSFRGLSSQLDPRILVDVVALAAQAAQSDVWAFQQLQSLASNLEYRAEMAKEILS